MRLKLWVFVILACAAVPTAAAGAKLAGEVMDLRAIERVRTYCVDTSQLPGWEALDVRDLIWTESKPKGLLSKLPWTLVKDCDDSDVDAVVPIKFVRMTVVHVGLGGAPFPAGNPQSAWPVPYQWRALLRVVEKSSSQVIYKAEGNPMNYNRGASSESGQEPDHVLRREAAYHAMAALVSDLKAISKNP